MAQPRFKVLLRAAFLIVIFTMVIMIITRCQDLNGAGSSSGKINPTPAPEFTQTNTAAWINSKPLSINHLKGKVTLIDIWTFECWNCYRSFPWLKKIESKYKNDLQVIGIHTPEFAHEKVRENVVKKIEEFGLKHPVMMDNDFAYWKALKNRYWPAFYVLDKKGIIRGRFIGETHAGDRNASSIEQLVSLLIKEK